jgi:hypothetical protein
VNVYAITKHDALTHALNMRKLYDAYVRAGFTEDQALDLIAATLRAGSN